MAFSGTATIHKVKDNMVRVTGLSLGIGSAGTFGLDGATGAAPGVRLPAWFQPQTYSIGSDQVTLQDSIRCEFNFVTIDTEPTPPTIAKTGTTDADFRITVTNTHSSSTPGIEFYITFHD